MFDVNYWCWKGILPNSLCDSIIEEGDKLVSFDGKVGYKSTDRYDSTTRDTNISFFEKDHWIESLCLHYAGVANSNAGWNLDVRYTQPIQYARYFPDQHYLPHRDDTVKPNTTEMRKLSVMIQITDPSLYEGGDFIIEKESDGFETIVDIKPRGSVIVFPSIIKHGVTPVTKGVRHSIVSWIMGPNFK